MALILALKIPIDEEPQDKFLNLAILCQQDSFGILKSNYKATQTLIKKKKKKITLSHTFSFSSILNLTHTFHMYFTQKALLTKQTKLTSILQLT